MESDVFPGIRFHSLALPSDARGISCDSNGPTIGPIRLLTKINSTFAPRPVEELNNIFAYVVERPVDCSNIVERLEAVAAAMNEKELVRAVFATLFLQLPPLSENQALRAARAAILFKASPDDPEHPGWPKGTEGGKGGQFRPKNEAAEETVERLARLAVRRQIRRELVHILSRHAARLAVDVVGDAIPWLDAISFAATFADLTAMADEYATLQTETKIAIEFVKNGPYSLDQLRVSSVDEAFLSYSAFRKTGLVKRFGSPGDGYEFHHIVEQSASSDIPERELQSTKNIIRIPKLLHEEITGQYSRSRYDFDGSSLRNILRDASFDERWSAGIRIMQNIGILKAE